MSLYLSIKIFWCFCHLMPWHSFSFWLSADTHIRSVANHPTFRGLLSDYSYMAYSMCQLDSSCEIPSMPLDDLCYHRHPLDSVPIQRGHVYHAPLPLGKVRHLIHVYYRVSLPLVCLTFLVII